MPWTQQIIGGGSVRCQSVTQGRVAFSSACLLQLARQLRTTKASRQTTSAQQAHGNRSIACALRLHSDTSGCKVQQVRNLIAIQLAMYGATFHQNNTSLFHVIK
eukprot:3488340-Amphidinium_carterae.3